MGIFARILAQGGVEWQWVVESGQLSMALVVISSEPLKISPNVAESLQKKYSAWTLVCGDILLMRIFAGVL